MDIQEVEKILENLRWLQTQMPTAIQNWQNMKPNCSYHTGVIKEICVSPGRINPLIFDPLILWLSNYILTREGRIAFPGPSGLDNFLRRGLVVITNYIAIADFFSKNPDFFVATDLNKMGETLQKQKTYQQIIETLSSKLIGCDKQLTFLFLDLTKSIKTLTPDLKRMQEFLDQKCLSLRISGVRR